MKRDLKTITLPDEEYGRQLYVSEDRPAYADLDPIENQSPHKPLGGLWTSTWKGRPNLSAWAEWSAAEKFYADSEKGWVLDMKTGSELVVIDSVADLEAAVEAYPNELATRTMMNFESMAYDYDGLWLTEEGQRQTHFRGGKYEDLYGWDVESTVWFSWRVAGVEPIGEIEWEQHPLYREW